MRVGALLSAVAMSLMVLACRRGPEAGGALRLGYFPNLTHAQALVGQAEGAFAREAGPVTARIFNAGPAAMEALLAGDLDLCYVGPGPAALAFLRSRGEALRVVAGAASGGAELVVRSARSPRDLAGRRVATPQLGNTQDLALRAWAGAVGLPIGDGPGQVRVTPLPNSDALSLFARGELEGAWVPEPWGARLRAAGGHVLVDERDLWPERRFPTTLLVASTKALATRRRELAGALRAHLALTERWRRDPLAFAAAANAAFGRLTGHTLEGRVLRDAFAFLEATDDPLRPQLEETARRAQALGFAPRGDLSALVDLSLLDEVRADRGRAGRVQGRTP